MDAIALIVGILGGGVGIASALGAFRGGKAEIQDKVISAYEKRLAQMEEDMADMKKELQDVNAKLDHAEKERILLTTVLQGRNPETEAFMQTTLKMLSDIHTKLFAPIPS